MRPTIKALLPIGAALLMASCQESGNNNDGTTQDTTAPAGIVLADVSESPEFPDAQLVITGVTAVAKGDDSTELTFNYEVKNYELKKQTVDTGSKSCNNSAQGQHIHFILDNQPYTALYEPTHKVTVANNSEHYVLSFLSRSYHESLKNKGAAVIYHFKLDKGGKLEKMPEPTTAMIFYSRPKGIYIGKDTENVLFDYYVWNGALSTDGLRVKAKIDSEGEDKEIDITNWRSQFLTHMPMGESKIELTLTDKDGKKLDGPQSTAGGKFTLAKQEPIQ